MVIGRSLALALAAGLAPACHAADRSAATQIGGAEALAKINQTALEPSRLDRFVGGEQVFNFAPSRIYEVRTAPLRVTTLTLGRGETITAIAGGDTVQWQIGQASSGEGDELRQHVLIKPFDKGLSTNLVVTTNRRVYLIALLSGPQANFNAAVSWKPEPPAPWKAAATSDLSSADPRPMLPTRYSITPAGAAPAWQPVAVATDGERTYITFPEGLLAQAAPILRLRGPDGRPRLVNYRQAGHVYIVDGVIDNAELRLGERAEQQVQIRRLLDGPS